MLLNVIDVIKIQEVAVLETSEPHRSHLLGPAYCLVLLIGNRILAHHTGKGYEHNVVVPRSLSDMFTMLLSIPDILRFVNILCTSSYDAFTYDLCLWRSTPKQ